MSNPLVVILDAFGLLEMVIGLYFAQSLMHVL